MTPLDVYCPDCGAREGKPCYTRKGTDRLRPHRQRVEALARDEARRAALVEVRSQLRALTDDEFATVERSAHLNGLNLAVGFPVGDGLLPIVCRLARRLAAVEDRRGEK